MNIDIVSLIENNPITKFNGDYKSKIIKKITDEFNGYEQQLFLSSFYCYLKYDRVNDFIIDLDNIWNWCGFSQKIKAKNLLISNFKINIDYKNLAPEVYEAKNIASEAAAAKKNTRGGHNKEIFMLTVNAFKKFCLKAATKKADEIHDYYIKLEEIMHNVLQEETNELNKQLLAKDNLIKFEMENKLKNEREREHEKTILKEYTCAGSIVYIIKVKQFENGQYIVKIGESRKGISSRYSEHKTKYGDILLLDCFKVDKSKDFESFIHKHETIRKHKVTDLEGHKNENELFLIGNGFSYKMLIDIIDKNINSYNYNVAQLLNEIESLKKENELLKENNLLKNSLSNNTYAINNVINENKESSITNDLINLIKDLSTKINNLSSKVDKIDDTNNEIMKKLDTPEKKITTGFNNILPTIGPRLQKIDPSTMQLIKVYETVSEAMAENKGIKRPSINKAIENNTIYCDFRWAFVERNLDPNILHNVETTKEIKQKNVGYIAKLNEAKTEIINVYIDRKVACFSNGHKSGSALDIAFKNQTPSNGFYYTLYEKCEKKLRDNFEAKHSGYPILYKNGLGQYDMNNNLIKEFSCKYDCIRELNISDKSLAKAIRENIPYKNFYYKELGEKLSI